MGLTTPGNFENELRGGTTISVHVITVLCGFGLMYLPAGVWHMTSSINALCCASGAPHQL